MKEDVLEQIMEDYLSKKGFFTKHNIKYLPNNKEGNNSNKYTNHSDIDILAFYPQQEKGKEKKVIAVSCKSWQTGVKLDKIVDKPNDVTVQKQFRELVCPEWIKAFADKIYELTGTKEFTYYLAITRVSDISKTEVWKDKFKEYFEENFKKILNVEIKVEIITFDKIFRDYWGEVNKKTLESTEIGRLIQLMKACKLDFSKQK